MRGKPINILCVGKLKKDFYRDACAHYLKLISRWRTITCEEIDTSTKKETFARIQEEGLKIRKHITGDDITIALEANGQNLTSEGFAKFLEELDQAHGKRLLCVIGGTFGFAKNILEMCHHTISLSPMTFAHELARVILLEQIYRAEAIARKLPYHQT